MAKGPFQNKIFVSLVGAVAFMFLFSFMLVPLYNVFCEVTGLNGKIYGPSDFFQKNTETYERQVNIRFLSTVNGSAPVTFYPTETGAEPLTVLRNLIFTCLSYVSVFFWKKSEGPYIFPFKPVTSQKTL
jgi:cytochrome c oxidase assembly protein Cox11